jgi:hypothetical protein
VSRAPAGPGSIAADLLAKHGIRTASQLIAVADATAHSPAQKRALLSTLQDREVLPNLQSLLSVIRNNDNLRLILTWHYAQTGNVRAA